MRKRPDAADRIARLFERRSLQGYVRWKVRSDPAYRAVLERVRDTSEPVLDLGCGIGLLAFYLREHGIESHILGVDFDERKIDVAARAALRYRGIDFIAGDARAPLPHGYNIVALDILQYVKREDRAQILSNIAAAVRPGGMVIIREGIRDASWRYRVQWVADLFGRVISWMKAERLEFPTREEVVGPFAGFDADIIPLWGRMPFNNYLFVFRRREAESRPE